VLSGVFATALCTAGGAQVACVTGLSVLVPVRRHTSRKGARPGAAEPAGDGRVAAHATDGRGERKGRDTHSGCFAAGPAAAPHVHRSSFASVCAAAAARPCHHHNQTHTRARHLATAGVRCCAPALQPHDSMAKPRPPTLVGALSQSSTPRAPHQLRESRRLHDGPFCARSRAHFQEGSQAGRHRAWGQRAGLDGAR